MIPGLKLRRSAGIPVTVTVHRLIAQGNRARDAREWPVAAAAYGRALAADASLGHIWLQHGHMLKEAGDHAAAAIAYAEAAARMPDSAEPSETDR